MIGVGPPVRYACLCMSFPQLFQKNARMRLISRTTGDVRSDCRARAGPAVGGLGVVLSLNRRRPHSGDVNKNRGQQVRSACAVSLFSFTRKSVFVRFDPRFNQQECKNPNDCGRKPANSYSRGRWRRYHGDGFKRRVSTLNLSELVINGYRLTL